MPGDPAQVYCFNPYLCTARAWRVARGNGTTEGSERYRINSNPPRLGAVSTPEATWGRTNPEAPRRDFLIPLNYKYFHSVLFRGESKWRMLGAPPTPSPILSAVQVCLDASHSFIGGAGVTGKLVTRAVRFRRPWYGPSSSGPRFVTRRGTPRGPVSVPSRHSSQTSLRIPCFPVPIHGFWGNDSITREDKSS